jgi:hypothetical protein
VGRAAGQVRAGLRYAWHKRELRVPLLMMAVVGTLAFDVARGRVRRPTAHQPVRGYNGDSDGAREPRGRAA